MKSKVKEIRDYIYGLPIIDQVVAWSKKYAIPGFHEVPIYDVLAFIIHEAKRDSITTRAQSVAFSFFISIFPFFIFIIPLMTRTPFVENYLDVFRESIQGVLPHNAEEYMVDILANIQLEGQTGWLTFGFFLAIFFASGGMLTLMTGFDKTYDKTFKSRSYVKKRVVAIFLTLLLSVLFITSILLIVLGQFVLSGLIELMGLSTQGRMAFSILRWFIMAFLLYSVITSIYRFGPSLRIKTNFLSPGATLATVLSILSSIAFSYFVNTFGSYNEIYGSIGALIVILLWFMINAFILLIGFELNASIAVNRDLRLITTE